MKKTLNALFLSAALIHLPMAFTGCSIEAEQAQTQSIWDTAVYTENQEIGEGALTFELEIVAEEKSITLTIHTDSSTLGEALVENKLVSGVTTEYGLYIKFVNGMEADYDIDGHYWSISRDGEYLMQGADSTAILDGEHYELARIK